MLPLVVRRTGRNNWDAPLADVRQEFDRLFDRYWGEPGTATGAYPVDIHEDEDHIYVEAEMPGFKRDDVNVTLENGMLTIEAERKETEKKGEEHLQERRVRRVARRFALPNTVDEGKVDAKLEDGVLHLTLHKREEVRPRRIEVK